MVQLQWSEKPQMRTYSDAVDLMVTKIATGQVEKYAKSGEVTEKDLALIKAEELDE